MVLYESGSRYEKFLLSGLGASHYDAARELPDGDFQLIWIGHGTDVEDAPFEMRHHLTPLQATNLTSPEGASSTGPSISTGFRRRTRQVRD